MPCSHPPTSPSLCQCPKYSARPQRRDPHQVARLSQRSELVLVNVFINEKHLKQLIEIALILHTLTLEIGRQ